MSSQADASIKIDVKADTKAAKDAIKQLNDEAKKAGSEGSAAAGKLEKGIGGVSAAASVASGGLQDAMSGAKGLAQALGSLSGGLAVTALVLVARLAYDLWQNAKKAKEEIESIRLGNLQAGMKGAAEWAERWRAGVETATLRAGLASGTRGARDAAALEAAQARLSVEKEQALAAAGGDASAVARVNADFEYRAAELAAKAAADASARALADIEAKRSANDDLSAILREEFESLQQAQREAISVAAGKNTAAEDARAAADAAASAGRRILEINRELARIEDENAALDERSAIEGSRSGTRSAALEAARLRRDNAIAGIDRAAEASGAAKDAGKASSSPLSVASDAMRRIGAEAGGAVSPVPQKLDLLAQITRECREYMRRVAEQTKTPIASFS